VTDSASAGRVFNFCAGPAALPQDVLERARDDMLNWHGRGLSFMEMSHRSAEVTGVVRGAEARLRSLLAIPDDYAVLFQQGGASLQFASVPLNLAGASVPVDYLDTGHWSRKAIAEARRFSDVAVVASSADWHDREAPPRETWQCRRDAAYFHCCPNETIGGLALHEVPDVEVPVVADMSSTLLSEPLDVGRFGVIYAGAQKNIGPAGLTLVIVQRELLGRAVAHCPSMLDWRVADDNESMYNTPPTFALYLAALVFEWLEERGGLAAMAEENRRKADTLYAAIDGSGLYSNPVAAHNRSRMNVPFILADAALDARFLEEAAQAGLLNLKGHRSVGGMRASLYNAVPLAAVEALVAFMQDFERRHG
jgi:phosphoserine aminotransferase